MGRIKGFIGSILLGYLFLVSCSNKAESVNQDRVLKVGTASQEGYYYGLGESMADLFADSEEKIKLEIAATNGSVDNIEKLSTGEIDLAIVQNDIAFFAENGLAPFNKKLKDLRGIISFYSEPIYVVTNDPSIDYLYQLRDRRVNTGPIGSGLFIDTRIILNSVDLWTVLTQENVLPVDGVDAVLNGEIDAAFTNALLDRHKEAIAEGNLKLVPIRSSTISMISNTYPYFERYDTNEFEFNQTTISVRALFVAREDLSDQVVYELTKKLHENYLELAFPVPHNTDVANQVISSMSLQSFHDGATSYYEQVGVMQSQNLLRLIGTISFVLLITILLILAIHFSSDNSVKKILGLNLEIINPIQRSYEFIVRHRYLMVLLFMVSSYTSIIMLVQNIEHNWAIQNNVVSDFDNRSFGSNLLWMFVFGGSGYIDNLFPNSPISKFLVALIRLIGIGGFLAIVGLFTSDQIRNRILKAKGGKRAMIKDHIILCGWNENIPFLIQNLLHENKINKKAIVILADPK
ncbi:MAG: TAXI family TRAP transporter solute-binding subunit, partial [Balneola sp.]